jgi:hypothetical protein
MISTPLCTLLALPASLSQNAWCALSLTPNPISNYAFAVLEGHRSGGTWGSMPLQFLAGQLTLSQPGGISQSDFQTFLRPCSSAAASLEWDLKVTTSFLSFATATAPPLPPPAPHHCLTGDTRSNLVTRVAHYSTKLLNWGS